MIGSVNLKLATNMNKNYKFRLEIDNKIYKILKFISVDTDNIWLQSGD